MELLGSLGLICTALGLLSAALVLLRTRRAVTALGVLLDFLLAAGLLRLSADATWRSLATAAVIVAVRKVAGRGLAFGSGGGRVG